MTRFLSRLLPARAAAPLPPPHPFSRIKLRDVTRVSLVKGQGDDEREWLKGDAALLPVLETAYSIRGKKHLAGDRIQPQTWDWRTNTPLPYTPLVWRVCVMEWSTLWMRERYTYLSCYEVNKAYIYHARATVGGPDAYLGWHTASMEIDRDYIDKLLSGVLAAYPGRARTIAQTP